MQTVSDPESLSRFRDGLLGERSANGLAYVMHPPGPFDAQAVSLDDVRLVRAMASRDNAALGAFYDRWADQVYATVISIVGTAQDAEEIVGDCFWQAWNQASRFDASRGQVRAWLMNIARSRALDRLKSVKRRREDDLDAAPVDSFATDVDAAGQIDEQQRALNVTDALKELPSSQREVLEMAYFGGLSQAEIAESTGTALGTVKTRIRLGMQKLRESLGSLERREA